MLDRIKLDGVGLRQKLLLAFVLVALLVGVTGFVGYHGVTTVDEEAHVIAEDGLKMDHAAELVVAIEQQQSAVQAARLGEPDARERFREAQGHFEERATALEESHLSDAQQERLDAIRTMHGEYETLATEFFEAREAGNDEVAAERAAEMDALRTEMEASAHAIEESAQADLEKQVAAADATTERTQLEVLGLSVLAFVVAVGVGLFVARRISTPVEQLSEAAVAISEGDLDVEVDGHVEDDEIGRLVDAFVEMQRNLRAIFADLDAVSQNLKAGELSQSFDADYPGTYGAVMGNLAAGTDRLATSFDRISTASAALKDGRLDQRVDTDYPGAYGDVLADVDDSLRELSASIGSAQEVAERVAATSQEVSASATEIEQAGEEVATSVEEISQGADEQSESLAQVASEMTDMSATVEEIASSAEAVARTASTAVERGETGREHAADATAEIQSIKSRTEEAASQIAALDEEVARIGEIVGIIDGIADQTNMLALNASIEAAQAGNAGEGFAVVADEIKELAEEAAAETTEIESRIEAVQATTTDTVAEIEAMTDRVERGADTIEDAVEMFDDIADAVSEAEGGIREISDATDDQAASSEEIVATVDQVSSVSQQTAAEAANVSAATEQQTASLSEATDSIAHLTELAEELNDEVAGFEIRSDDVGLSAGTTTAGPGGSTTTAAADGGFDASGEPTGR